MAKKNKKVMDDDFDSDLEGEESDDAPVVGIEREVYTVKKLAAKKYQVTKVSLYANGAGWSEAIYKTCDTKRTAYHVLATLLGQEEMKKENL